uniref:HTH_48 domain-containing protein n=1 Tax=Strongyloides papillosus TaxID=174720 RepID=A0A0N5B7H1_STREA
MLLKRDIRAIMLYEFKRGTNAAKTTQKINETFGENLVNTSTVQRWFKKFKEGNENLENEERGRPEPVIDNEELRKAIEANPRKTVRALAEDLNVSKSTISLHLKEIEKAKNLDKHVPHELNDYQKMRRYEVCSSLVLRNNNDPFLERIIIFDEKLITYNNRKRTGQWLDSNEAGKRKLFPEKIMVTVWWSIEGVIHYELMEPGETITSESYCQQLEEMHQNLSKKRPLLINSKGPILLYDNRKPYISLMTLQKLNQLGYETLPHPAYSPDLFPTDFYFFKHLDNFLTENTLRKDGEIKIAIKDFIESRNPDFFANGINKLESRWQQFVHSNGSYFE